MPSRHQSKPSPQWQEYVWRATLPGQRGSGAAGSRPLRWVDGASGSAAVSLRRSKAIEPASRPKSHGISVSALGPVAPNAASKVGGAMVEACRIRQGPAHFTRPPVACRFAPTRYRVGPFLTAGLPASRCGSCSPWPRPDEAPRSSPQPTSSCQRMRRSQPSCAWCWQALRGAWHCCSRASGAARH